MIYFLRFSSNLVLPKKDYELDFFIIDFEILYQNSPIERIIPQNSIVQKLKIFLQTYFTRKENKNIFYHMFFENANCSKTIITFYSGLI